MIRQTGGTAVGEISTRSSPFLLGNGQRGGRRHDPELLPGLVDHADFSNTNTFVGANAVVTSGRTIESDTASSGFVAAS
jgi:hypothetical protein